MFITVYQFYFSFFILISLWYACRLSFYTVSSSHTPSGSFTSFPLSSSSHFFFYFPLLTSFSIFLFSLLFLTTFSTSTDSSKGDEVTDLYLVHSNMAILNLVSQVRYTLLQCHVLCSSAPFLLKILSSHLVTISFVELNAGSTCYSICPAPLSLGSYDLICLLLSSLPYNCLLEKSPLSSAYSSPIL